MDGDLSIVILRPYFDTRYSFELAFQCHRLEVNPMVRSDVMPVLLKSGMSASRDKVVEEMNGMSIVGAPLVAIDGDARTWAEPISRTT
ncbi:hypothetical protein F2Q70_00004372 [Brassica cretica]|uniref:Uncharacterized protein n=1 Tax=Brassica cretica TaxID=69181 RepID=A0A8S9IRW9_BRACR|nr:hypothetical protein F2Q70_00004372 [Brassica cretica]